MALDLKQVQQDVTRALAEDVGTGDITAQLIPDTKVTATISSREPMLMCGQPWVNETFRQLDSNVVLDWKVAEGTYLAQPQVLCSITGSGRALLTAERTALNFLQTLSATATQTHRYVTQLKPFKAKLLDTRKTLPGLRIAQKYAVRCGGGINHRMGLFDVFLIKENHIKACGSVSEAIRRARAYEPSRLLVVEVETLEQLKEALAAGPDRILLDNFTPDQLASAVHINQSAHCELEASGGVTLDNIALIAQSGVDFISVGAMTKSIQAIDLSLLITEQP